MKLESFNQKYLKDIHKKGFSEDNPKWTKFNAPYFKEYKKFENFEDFCKSEIGLFHKKQNVRAIIIDKRAIGLVSRYWISKNTRWLEIGIVIYDENMWHKGYGKKALKLWIDDTFKTFKELEHIGLTTFSGNESMMRLSEKIGMKMEARIRKVRFYNGIYYDSIKYGILREEWDL
ncbi:MAG: GNAT family protein [Tissierellia bacterium]|nr:GNAT family protein [Tissierellia bacterium]